MIQIPYCALVLNISKQDKMSPFGPLLNFINCINDIFCSATYLNKLVSYFRHLFEALKWLVSFTLTKHNQINRAASVIWLSGQHSNVKFVYFYSNIEWFDDDIL